MALPSQLSYLLPRKMEGAEVKKFLLWIHTRKHDAVLLEEPLKTFKGCLECPDILVVSRTFIEGRSNYLPVFGQIKRHFVDCSALLRRCSVGSAVCLLKLVKNLK